MYKVKLFFLILIGLFDVESFACSSGNCDILNSQKFEICYDLFSLSMKSAQAAETCIAICK